MVALKDITGLRFGRLVVTGRSDNDSAGRSRWVCACDCGARRVVNGSHLRSGHTTSCGCGARADLSRRRRKHGMADASRGYSAWRHMRYRCSDSATGRERRNYFDRGVRVCARWDSFEAFIADMGEPLPGQSIDRIDNSRGYEPGNCRWADSKTQNNNSRQNHWIEHAGQRKTLSQWAESVGLPRHVLHQRLLRGWQFERSISEPVRRSRAHATATV